MKRVALLSICLALSAQTQSTDRDLDRAYAAADKFRLTWKDWAENHNRYTISRADKERFKKVRKAWKEFDSLYKLVE